jgi:hypothetical protein
MWRNAVSRVQVESSERSTPAVHMSTRASRRMAFSVRYSSAPSTMDHEAAASGAAGEMSHMKGLWSRALGSAVNGSVKRAAETAPDRAMRAQKAVSGIGAMMHFLGQWSRALRWEPTAGHAPLGSPVPRAAWVSLHPGLQTM